MRLPRIRLPKAVVTKIGEATLKIGKKKPELCLIAGILLGGGALVLTAVETWNGKEKIENDIQEIKVLRSAEPIQEVIEIEGNAVVTDMTVANRNKLIRKAYGRTGLDFFKIYWKPIALGGTSLILIITSHRMLRRSLAEMAAMYAGLFESFRQYRKNLIDDLGPEKDQEYLYGAKQIETIDAETGENITKTVPTGTPNLSPYSVWYNEGIYDEDSGKWIWQNSIYRPNKTEFEVLLRNIQNECNDILRMRGYMFLNEVYTKLGLPPTSAGQHVGWVRNGLTNGVAGDDYIDFGVFPEFCGGKYQLPVNKLFLDPRSNQRYPLLDFNVICIDSIFDDIFEYDNKSYIAYDKRKTKGYSGSLEHLNRWFEGNEAREKGL